MAIRNIVQEGDPILLKNCRPVEKFDHRLHVLLGDMADTMKEANGVGLAAPQVGILRRICMIQPDTEGDVIELINPEVIEADGEQNGAEGCLSYPGQFGLVKRPMHVTVRAQDRNGKWFEISQEGLGARACCHEIDHLNGVVFTTHASRMLTQEELESGEVIVEEEPEE